MKRALRRLDAVQTGNYPGGKILRRKAPTRSGDVTLGNERLVQHGDACFLDPGFRRQVRTRRDTLEQPELGQHERARALRTQQLP